MRSLRLLSLSACLMSAASAADPLDQLSTRESLSGSFIQSIVSPEGAELERAEGQFRLLRPHYFWWEIERPDQQLLISINGQLTQIDWDLEVVSRRHLSPQDRMVLQLLFASREELETAFSLEVQEQFVVLTAYEEGAPITRLSIEHPPETQLWRLSLTDRSGQEIQLILKESFDRRLNPADFAIPSTDFD